MEKHHSQERQEDKTPAQARAEETNPPKVAPKPAPAPAKKSAK
jgi:hypothetical protein